MVPTSEEFRLRLEEDVELINDWIEDLLPEEDFEIVNIVEAMHYSVKAGGKRLRPILMYETYRLFGGDSEAIFFFAVALECIHTYSLVHDDLPAMDNDYLRRGKPTTHAKYGEATGILAGDALLTYAFELATHGALVTDEQKNAVSAMRELAKCSGYAGMIAGQVLDLDAEGRQDLKLEDLINIYNLKTGCLLECAFIMGCILAGRGTDDELSDMEDLGYCLGVAFQIQDDILDVTGSEEELGKPIGSDDKNNKITAVTLLGLDGAKELAREYTDRAVALIERYEEGDGFIRALILSLLERSS